MGSNTHLIIKIRIVTINIFLPTKHEFVYPSIKLHAPGFFSELLGSIFCILMVIEAFFLQKKKSKCVRNALLARGQVIMVDKSKFYSPSCSTFEALVVERVVRGKKLGLLLLTSANYGSCSLRASHRFAEHT